MCVGNVMINVLLTQVVNNVLVLLFNQVNNSMFCELVTYRYYLQSGNCIYSFDYEYHIKQLIFVM